MSSFSPGWPPRGRKLPLITTGDTASCLVVAEIATAEKKSLLDTSDTLGGVVWSPDGDSVLVERV